jgi:acylphosphatase
MKTGKIIQVYGRVQGVNFRYHTQMTATKFNIHGFVRNEYDGSVYIEAEGEDIDINNFIHYLCKGPVFSKVVDMKIIDNAIMNYKGFCIKY